MNSEAGKDREQAMDEIPAPGPFADGDEAIVARAGGPRPPDAGGRVSEESVVEALRTVYDPEIPVNIYELGLIYGVDIDEAGDVKVTMTLTTPGCPVAGSLPQQVADAVAGVPEVGSVKVALVWDPPWTMDKMSEDAKLALGMF